MPGFDGTGPRGMGPMTGGGRGFCSPRMGYGYPYYGVPTGVPPMTPEQELDFLRNQASMMRSQLEQIEARTRELEAKGK